MEILSYIAILLGLLLYLHFSKLSKTNVEKSELSLIFSLIFLVIGLATNIISEDHWWITLVFATVVVGLAFLTGVFITFIIEYKESYVSDLAERKRGQEEK